MPWLTFLAVLLSWIRDRLLITAAQGAIREAFESRRRVVRSIGMIVLLFLALIGWPGLAIWCSVVALLGVTWFLTDGKDE